MTEPVRFLLDTHAALWLQLEPTRLGPQARRALAGVSPECLLISDVTLSETARLLSTGRLETEGRPEVWLERFALGFTSLAVTPSIAWAAAAFPWEHRDPCDRHILATAAVSSLPLVTLDPKISSFASKIGVPIVW
jgi:PIN domain nuclease of toxin-antitoxin system